jgi:hypothetical protein
MVQVLMTMQVRIDTSADYLAGAGRIIPDE